MLKRILLSLTLSTSAFSAENTSDFNGLPFEVPSNIQKLLSMPENDIKAFSSLQLEEAYEAVSDLIINEKLSTRLMVEEQEIERLKGHKELRLSNIDKYSKEQEPNMLNFSNERLAVNRRELSETETKLQKLEASIAPIVHFKQRLEKLQKLMEDIDSATTD